MIQRKYLYNTLLLNLLIINILIKSHIFLYSIYQSGKGKERKQKVQPNL